MIRRARGADRRIVMTRPGFLTERRLRYDPADPQPGKAVGLRQTVDDDHLVVARAPEALRRLSIAFGALVDLVGKDPGSDFRGAIENHFPRRVAENVAGGIMRVGDD